MASAGLLSLLTPPGKVPGTGLLSVATAFKQRFGGSTDPAIMGTILASLPATFGDYPVHADVAPSAIFVAIFCVLALSYFYIFAKDYSRGHRFWAFFGLGAYSILRIIGFGLRIQWSRNVMQVQLGIASTVFTLVSVLFINMLNMLFGHRIFTHRHPETGNASWFNLLMATTYFFVIGVIIMAILGQALPFIYYMPQRNLDMCRKVVQAAAILQIMYAFAGITLVAFAYIIPPGKIDHHFGRFNNGSKDILPKTFSATWLESCSPFYFPRKGSQQILHRGDPRASYIRVMPSQTRPAKGLADHNEDHVNGPKMSVAIALIATTSLLLSLSSGFRCASTFIFGSRGGTPAVPYLNWIFHNWVLYLFYGAFEVIVNILLLVFRADLRFYIPDMAIGSGGSKGHAAVNDQNTSDSELAVNQTANTVVPAENLQKLETSHVQ